MHFLTVTKILENCNNEALFFRRNKKSDLRSSDG